MADESLLLLATEVRGKTLRLLEGVSAEMARFTPAGLSNTILWHAGHALVVVEHLGVRPVTGVEAPGYPAEWAEKFRWNSVPASVKNWPPLAEVVEALHDQLARLTTAVGALDGQDLDRIIDPAKQRTLRYSVLHGLHDEAGHQGEIWLLRKLYGIQTGAGGSAGV